jgi:protein gp37
MGKTTGISWTNATWNPWQGCTKVSDGCKNCYMYREKARYGQDPFTVVRSTSQTFNAPLHWNLRTGSRIFMCSWSDFYHVDADDWRYEAWEIIRALPQYNFLIPTKRIERLGIEGDGFMLPKNVWMGVSVENQKAADERIPILAEIPAKVKWLSIEPMLEEISLIKHFNYSDNGDKWTAPFEWVVYGGESGPNCRLCNPEWIRLGIEQCRIGHVPVFVKQLGGWPDTRKELFDLPQDLRVREFPA